MGSRKKKFKDNFKLRNISDLDVVLLGIGIFIWFTIIRLLNPKLENYESSAVDATSPFVSILFIIIFVGYLLIIGMRVGYKKGKQHLLEDLNREGKLKS